MLLNLHVKNFAIINEIEVDFEDNLNILTGETGAGKSIIIGSVYVALGGKVTKEMIKTGADYALVEMSFSIEDERILSMLEDLDLSLDDDVVVISRKIMSNGRNALKVNGQTVSNSDWKIIASNLIDIHGQNEHQSLLKNSYQLDILDKYAKDDLVKLKSELKVAYHEYKEAQSELNDASIDESARLREIELLRYEIEEINNARLMDKEDEELEVEYKKLSHAKVIMDNLSMAKKYLEDDNENAIGQVGRAYKSILKANEYDEELSSISDAISVAEQTLNDVLRMMDDYISNIDNFEERFFEVSERLNLINHLKNKYGRTIDDIISYGKACEDKLIKYEAYDEYIEELKIKLEKSKTIVADLSTELSDIRKEKALVFEKEIIDALIELNFLQVEFEIAFDKKNDYSENGFDDIEFMISMNPGQALYPLNKVASGGELSRVMLAIKSILASTQDIHTLIFDEIDSGISGRTAQKVSEKLAKLSRENQVICITHLPQIAAMADTHYVIEKITEDNNTFTNIRKLEHNEIINELARLLGGVEITDSVKNNAIEMKELANSIKKQ